MFSQVLTILHARQVALCHKLLNSTTSRPGHKLSTLLPLKRNFSYKIGPTPRRIKNRFKNSFIPSMCFCCCCCFFFWSRDGIIICSTTRYIPRFYRSLSSLCCNPSRGGCGVANTCQSRYHRLWWTGVSNLPR